jgi:hypothetical protein
MSMNTYVFLLALESIYRSHLNLIKCVILALQQPSNTLPHHPMRAVSHLSRISYELSLHSLEIAADGTHLADVGADHTDFSGGQGLVVRRGHGAIEDAGTGDERLQPGEVVRGGGRLAAGACFSCILSRSSKQTGIVVDPSQRRSQLLWEICEVYEMIR